MKAPDFHKTVGAVCSAIALGLLAISLAAPQGVWADDDHGRGRGNEKSDDDSTAPGQLKKLDPIGAGGGGGGGGAGGAVPHHTYPSVASPWAPVPAEPSSSAITKP